MAASSPAAPRPIITFTTDFGLQDAYVAAMKGVALGICRDAALVDVTHQVRPQQVLQGAFLLGNAWPYFPDGAVHVAVVDPGVGTARRAVALATPRAVFVGPDNGLLSSALPDHVRPDPASGPQRITLPSGYRAVSLTNPAYHRHPVSDTFHGRDVFAPAAAHLAAGVPPENLGEPAEDLLALPPFRARRTASGVLVGRIIHIDRFGNCITEIRGAELPPGPLLAEHRGRSVPGPFRTYADLGEGPGLLVGSEGYAEIAVKDGSAEAVLGAAIGDLVVVRTTA